MADDAPIKMFVGENISGIVMELLQQLRQRGASASGTNQAGSFSATVPGAGMISGSYAAAGQSLEISLHNRPENISWSTIEAKLQDFVLDAKAVAKNRAPTGQAGA